MKHWYNYKIYILKKTNRLTFVSMRQHGIPKKIIGQVILDEVKDEFNHEMAAYHKSLRVLNRRIL